jgi:hypothetical protein
LLLEGLTTNRLLEWDVNWYTRFKRKRMVLLKKKSVSKLEEKRFCNLHIPYGNTLHHKENAT